MMKFSSVLVLWVCWICIQSYQTAAWSSSTAGLLTPYQSADPKRNYFTIIFTTRDANSESYQTFMESLRDRLGSGQETHAIPLLRQPSLVPDSQRYVLVQLVNSRGQFITIAHDVINAYVVAYRAGNRAYFFTDAPANAQSNLFTDITTPPQSIGHDGSYGALQRAGNTTRRELGLGMIELDHAISTLVADRDDHRARARALLVIIQMVSEAARYKYIERRVHISITNGVSFHPDPLMLSFQNNWGELSAAIQQTTQLAFARSVQLDRPDYRVLNVDSVNTELIANMAIILWVCISSPPPPPPRSSSLLNYPVPYLANNGVCEKPEPTVRIIGRDGLCVDVRDSRYNDGNPIQVSPCSTTNAMNQQWSLRTDGTIRSGGKCLTASRNTPGSTVVIHDCNTALAAATRWQLSVSGTMMHQAYGLVLSANSRGNGATLTLERDISSIAQGWRTTNNLQPFVTSIYGMMNLCLEANGAGLRLQGCASNRAAQMWALYPDGSIRPQQNQNNCMACASLSQGASMRLESCAQALTTHRWVFTNEGTIMHLQSRLVMEVRNSNPSLGQFIISPSNGNANQKWLPSL